MIDFEEIKKSVKESYKSVAESVCECGGKLKINGHQALAYSPEDKAMVDLMGCICEKCGKEQSIACPIKSNYGQAMAGFMQRMQELKAKGIRMWSGHTILEGEPYIDESFHIKEKYTLKLQCYKCSNIFEYNSPQDGWRVYCPKCDAC